MSTWNEIKDSPAGTEFTDKDGDRWRFTKTKVECLTRRFAPQTRKNGNADCFFGDNYYGPYTVTKTPDTTTPPGDEYLSAALLVLGMGHTITASTISEIIETARKIREATK